MKEGTCGERGPQKTCACASWNGGLRGERRVRVSDMEREHGVARAWMRRSVAPSGGMANTARGGRLTGRGLGNWWLRVVSSRVCAGLC